jgi:hypothetical protein
MNIPESYRVTEKDCHEAWLIVADREKYIALAEEHEEQANLVSAFIEAGQMKHSSGQWPTLGEVYEKWRSEEEKQERLREERETKHAATMKVWNGQRAKQSAV